MNNYYGNLYVLLYNSNLKFYWWVCQWLRRQLFWDKAQSVPAVDCRACRERPDPERPGGGCSPGSSGEQASFVGLKNNCNFNLALSIYERFKYLLFDQTPVERWTQEINRMSFLFKIVLNFFHNRGFFLQEEIPIINKRQYSNLSNYLWYAFFPYSKTQRLCQRCLA